MTIGDLDGCCPHYLQRDRLASLLFLFKTMHFSLRLVKVAEQYRHITEQYAALPPCGIHSQVSSFYNNLKQLTLPHDIDTLFIQTHNVCLTGLQYYSPWLLAGDSGLEPKMQESNSCVLPLHQSPMLRFLYFAAIWRLGKKTITNHCLHCLRSASTATWWTRLPQGINLISPKVDYISQPKISPNILLERLHLPPWAPNERTRQDSNLLLLAGFLLFIC